MSIRKIEIVSVLRIVRDNLLSIARSQHLGGVATSVGVRDRREQPHSSRRHVTEAKERSFRVPNASRKSCLTDIAGFVSSPAKTGILGGLPAQRRELSMDMKRLIAQVNDTFRREAMNGVALSMPGMIVATPRVQALPDPVQRRIFEAIRDYDRFNDGDDQFPDEHAHGFFCIDKEMFVWKIDWTADPTGIVIPENEKPETFFRVLTIMFAEEV